MYTHIKALTFLLPLFCLLLYRSSGASTTTTVLPPPPSTLLAAETLRARGYSHVASLLLTLSNANTNYTGTLLAAPDFAFSFATGKFFNHHRSPPRPTISLLLYHTIKSPLTWPSFSSRDQNELHTLYYNKCLFLFKNGFEVTVSSSPYKNPISAVKIRQPDLYVDEHLTVHGIDGVLDPTYATKCSFDRFDGLTAEAAPRQRNRLFLDHAMRGLRRSGYNVVAAAMAVTRSDLLSLTSVTVFAVSDKNLFVKSGGFAYDFRHHVVPMRHRLATLEKLAVGETEFDTLAVNKSVVVDSVDGAVRVNGVAVDGTEVYRNRWIVVVSIVDSLDKIVCSEGLHGGNLTAGNFPDYVAPSPARYSGSSGNSNLTGVNSTAAENLHGGGSDSTSVGAPSPVVDLNENSSDDFVITSGVPSPAPATEAVHDSVSSPATETEGDDVGDTHCDLNAAVSLGVEGGDIFCPGRKARELLERESLTDVHVEESNPLDADGQEPADVVRSDEVKVAENVNVADDLFFYI